MNTHRLTHADFDDVMTEPAVHEVADTQWPAFTEPMAFDAPEERSAYRAADFALAAVAAVAAALWIAGVI